VSRFLTENRFTLFLEPLRRAEEAPGVFAEAGGEAVAEIHLQLRQRHKRIAAAAQRRDPSLERCAGRDTCTAVTAVDQAVAVAGLAAAIFLKCQHRPDFRFHSNHRIFHPLPPRGGAFSSAASIKRARIEWISPGTDSRPKARARQAKIILKGCE
jgi:hypothetical protein